MAQLMPLPLTISCSSKSRLVLPSWFYLPPGMQASIIWCLSYARINWEGCARKGIRCKNGGDGRDGGHQFVWMGQQSIRTVGVSACVIFILHQKIQKMAKCTFWYQLTRVVLDKVHRAVKWLCVYFTFLVLATWVVPDTIQGAVKRL